MSKSDLAPAGSQRTYESPVRDQRALDTRRRICEAALSLFGEHGFAETRVASIAARAGVATPTVYATFGSKGAIVRALIEQMEHNADSAGWAQRIAAESNPHAKLAAFASWTTVLFSSSKAIIKAAAGAASDPMISELGEEGNRQRRNGLRAVIGTLAHTNSLRTDLTQERALDRAWMLTGVDLYLSATDGCGWTDQEYEQRLGALLHQQLLATQTPAPASSVSR